MDMRTAFLAVAALGLVSMTVGAPSAAADTTVPSEETYPGHCMQVYLFEASVGPATVDASDSCPQVVVDDENEQKWPPTVCVYPFGCR